MKENKFKKRRKNRIEREKIMKKIINGKKYDTETATKIGVWSNGLSFSDFKHCSESIYRKKTGEFFLHGEGGPMSAYSKSCGENSWSGGEQIVPLTEDEAKKWVENHLGADEYEEIFGKVEE